MAAPLLVGKENLSQDAEAIFAQATKLAPLLSRAEQVMQKHRESKGALSFQSGEANWHNWHVDSDLEEKRRAAKTKGVT